MAVLVVSSEPDELPDLCDRVLVMAEGRIVRELTGSALTRNAIIEASYAEGRNAETRDHDQCQRLPPPPVPEGEDRARHLRALRDHHRPPRMIAAFAVLSPRAFPTLNNFTNVLNQASLTMIIAAGLTLAVVVGELDLSVGFAASLHGILVTGLIVSNGLPIPLAILIVLCAGALIGLVNGLIVTKIKVNSVIATLGVGTILTGLAFAYSAGVPIVSGVRKPSSSCRWAAGSSAFPNNIVIMALVVGGLWVLVERSALGQEIQAVGGNPAAARLAASTSTASRSSAS